MSYKDYWFGDPWIIVAHRKADKLNRDRRNQEMWLQGMYIHDSVSIAIANAFGKKGANPILYPNKPYAITKPEQERDGENRQAQESENKRLIAMVENSKFERAAKRTLKARRGL